jgi:hypothetical protein
MKIAGLFIRKKKKEKKKGFMCMQELVILLFVSFGTNLGIYKSQVRKRERGLLRHAANL